MENREDIPEYGRREFADNDKINKYLQCMTPLELTKTREGPGKTKLFYIESDTAFQIANLLFGFDGWSTTVRSYNIIQKGEPVIVTACVRVELKNGAYREDVGVGASPAKLSFRSMAQAIDVATKSAVTDATKRALRLFGNLLGNSLYQKRYLDEVLKIDNNIIREYFLVGDLTWEKLEEYVKKQNDIIAQRREADRYQVESNVDMKALSMGTRNLIEKKYTTKRVAADKRAVNFFLDTLLNSKGDKTSGKPQQSAMKIQGNEQKEQELVNENECSFLPTADQEQGIVTEGVHALEESDFASILNEMQEEEYRYTEDEQRLLNAQRDNGD